MREADELGQPAHHSALEVDVGVVAEDGRRIHRGSRQRNDDAGGGGRRVDPAEEGRVAVAHGMWQHVAQRGRHQVVERGRTLRQRQVEQLLAQGVGERLPDRARRQRGEVVGDAVHQRVRGAAERLQLRLRAPRPCPVRSYRKHRFRASCDGRVN